MRDKTRTNRPAASEAAIREMHDLAAAAAVRASQHETNALRIIGEAEKAAEEMVGAAGKRAEEHVEKARALAAQHVARAESEAEQERRKAQAEADENLRQAHLVAQQERDRQMAEQRDRDYWTSLAADQAVDAGLPPAAPTSPLTTLPDGEARDA